MDRSLDEIISERPVSYDSTLVSLSYTDILGREVAAEEILDHVEMIIRETA